MARSTEMGVAESYDRRVVIAVAGTGLVDHRLILSINIMRNSVGVRAELHATERHACSGESVTHSVCADKGINIACLGLSHCGGHTE